MVFLKGNGPFASAALGPLLFLGSASQSKRLTSRRWIARSAESATSQYASAIRVRMSTHIAVCGH